MFSRWIVLLAAGVVLLLVAGCQLFEKTEEAGAATRRLALPPPPARDGLIPVGLPAPDFEATDHQGRRVVLSELLASKDVVLIFYPADFTPVCTRQLCAVRDDWSEFERRNAIVLGANPATVPRHAEFAEVSRFPFPLISDPKGRIAAGYGCAGRNPAHPQRTVYVIRQDGRVALAERGVVPHSRILAALDRP